MTMRTRRRRSSGLDQFKEYELLYGPSLIAGVGYFTYYPDIERPIVCDTEAMRRDWEIHRERLLANWEGPGRPYAEEHLGA